MMGLSAFFAVYTIKNGAIWVRAMYAEEPEAWLAVEEYAAAGIEANVLVADVELNGLYGFDTPEGKELEAMAMDDLMDKIVPGRKTAAKREP